MALIYCSNCGKQVSDKATTCVHCNAALSPAQPQVQPQPQLQPQMAQQPFQQHTNATQQAVYVNVPSKQSNGIGTAGLVLSILGLFLGWIPVLGWIVWFLGVLFSFIGMFKSPRGCAIAGFIISFIWLIIFVFAVGSIASLAAFS